MRGSAAAAVVSLVAALSPTAGSAAPTQEDPLAQSASPEPAIHIDADVVNGDPDEVAGVFDDLTDDVAEQLGDLRNAENALSEAETSLTEAGKVVSKTETRIDDLMTLRDEVVVEAFVSPNGGNGVESLVAPSMTDLAMKSTLLDMRADDDASVLTELEDAHSDLEDQKTEEEERATEARDARNDAAARLGDLESAVDRQTMFFASVELRLEQGAAEASALAELDPDLAAELEDERDALAAKFQEILDAEEWAEAVEALAKAMKEAEERRAVEEAAAEAQRQREAEAAAAAEAASSPSPEELGPTSGELTTVSCPGGGSITVDSSLANNLSNLLSAASAGGVTLCGGGYRDPKEQIALRKQNCGPSSYAIYEMPASQCSPPTARPGTSQHERGLAIDFTCNGGGAISSQSSPCFVWLQNNAAGYGLYNLPSEPWHWSTTGN